MGKVHVNSRVLHRSLRETPPKAVGGEGIWLIPRTAGRSSTRPAAPPCPASAISIRVIAAITEQAGKLAYAHTSFFTSEPAETLATIWSATRRVASPTPISSAADRRPSRPASSSRASISSRAASPSAAFHRAAQSYHGNTLGALSAGGNAWRRAPYAPLLSPAFSHVTPAFAYHEQRETNPRPITSRGCRRARGRVPAARPRYGRRLHRRAGGGRDAGCVTAPQGYFRAVREICDRHGALLILDEVMCGMGRTGTLHAWEQEGVSPDIQRSPRASAAATSRSARCSRPAASSTPSAKGSGAFQHGHTYLAHPVACAAALEVQRVTSEEELLDRVKEPRRAARERLGALRQPPPCRRYPRPRAVPGHGVRAIAPASSRSIPALKLQPGSRRRLRARPGLLPVGRHGGRQNGDHVLLAPPYIVYVDDIDMIVEASARPSTAR